jgi:hypothetical protein
LRLMSRFLGRDSRRRRVLNEEALSASTAHLALRATTPDEPADDAPRYSEAAGVEHHPQVTDFVPRRFRSVGMLAFVGVASTAAVEALHQFAVPFASNYGFATTAAFDIAASGGLAAWLSAIVLLLAAAVCMLIYSLRRHRVDDFKGRYRVWMAAAVACGLLSLVSVAPVHRLLTALAVDLTGWTALRSDAAWWMLAAGLPCAWIAARAWLDARESSLAAVSLAGAFALYGVAVGSYLSAESFESSNSEATITCGARLLAHWLLLVGVVSYSRFVVLDVQGLIPVRTRRPAASKSKAVTKDQAVKHSSSRSAAASTEPLHSIRAKIAETESAETSTLWIDGSEPISENYDDEDGDPRIRKLSKADRKRIRQQKRAA